MNNYQIIRKINSFRPHGFTLFDLLIVILIIGVLASITYPSYQSYLLRLHRTDALQTLTKVRILLERCYAQNFAYSTTCGALPQFPHASAQGYYTITINNKTSSTYTLTAMPVGGQAKDKVCTSFSVNQANVKTATGSDEAAQDLCWKP